MLCCCIYYSVAYIEILSFQMETLESLWKENTCVIIFFRRWGCLFCRQWAKDLGQISNILNNNNIRLIGVGPEELGVEEFKDGKFFDGGQNKIQSLNLYFEVKAKKIVCIYVRPNSRII